MSAPNVVDGAAVGDEDFTAEEGAGVVVLEENVFEGAVLVMLLRAEHGHSLLC